MRRLLTIPLLICLAAAQQKPLVPMPGHHHSHPTRTKVIIITGGVATGAIVGLLTRQKTCPKTINGYSYDGTSPCPGKNYDPGGKRR